MSKKDLLWTVKEFRAGMLDKRPSNRMCFAVCAPLQSYLSALGIETELVNGSVLDEAGEKHEHFWLALTDDRIIDPTADQFSTQSRKMPKVYIGNLPDFYKEEITIEKLSLR